jgi:hypothetical protein
MAARPSRGPESDFGVVLRVPSGQAARTGEISNGAHIHDAGAFYKRCGCAFSRDAAMLADVHAVACEFAAA